MKTMLIALLAVTVANGAPPNATTQPIRTITQTERLVAAEEANYEAHLAFERQDWKEAMADSDKVARLLQDAVVAESKDALASR